MTNTPRPSYRHQLYTNSTHPPTTSSSNITSAITTTTPLSRAIRSARGMLDLGNARARRLAESSNQAVLDANFDPKVGDFVKYFNEFMKTETNPLGTQ